MAEPASRPEVEALLALAVTRRAPGGPCPTLEDIAQWYEGTLAPGRRETVVHHLAHCDACFEVLTGLLDSAVLLDSPHTSVTAPLSDAPPGRRRWFSWPLPAFATTGLAAGFAVALMLAVLLPTLQQPSLEARLETGFEDIARSGAAASLGEQWPWSAGYQSRSVADAEPAGQLAAATFRAGLAAGLVELAPKSDFWNETIAGFKPDDTSCQGVDAPGACQAIEDAMVNAGRWAALLHVACAAREDESPGAADRVPEGFWDAQAEVLATLRQDIGATLPGTSFARLFEQWQEQVTADGERAAALCGRTSTLVTLGFSIR